MGDLESRNKHKSFPAWKTEIIKLKIYGMLRNEATSKTLTWSLNAS